VEAVLQKHKRETSPPATPEAIGDENSWLLISGFYAHEAIEDLKTKYGVTHVTNMAHGETGEGDKCKEAHEEAGMAYLGFDGKDVVAYDIMQHWEEIKPFVEDFNKTRGEKDKLLVHCMAGVNRSAAVVVAVVCHTEDKPLLEAITHAHRHRGTILTNKPFGNNLVNWARKEKCLVE
jgi:protein-tyrosine phosphatase